MALPITNGNMAAIFSVPDNNGSSWKGNEVVSLVDLRIIYKLWKRLQLGHSLLWLITSDLNSESREHSLLYGIKRLVETVVFLGHSLRHFGEQISGGGWLNPHNEVLQIHRLHHHVLVHEIKIRKKDDWLRLRGSELHLLQHL